MIERLHTKVLSIIGQRRKREKRRGPLIYLPFILSSFFSSSRNIRDLREAIPSLQSATPNSLAVTDMETPAIPGPKDQSEKDVLEKLIAIRDQLQLRKLDRTTYVRTQDVMVLYDQTIEQVRILNESRGGKPVQENRGTVPLLQP